MHRFAPGVRVIGLLLTLSLLVGCSPAGPGGSKGTEPPALAAKTGESGVTCDPATSVYGLCLDSGPKLYCCSAGYLGWSQIVVGTELPLKGRVRLKEGAPPPPALLLTYPSGREERIPVAPDGAFDRTVSFSDEGIYHLQQTATDSGTQASAPDISFWVAYRVDPMDAPTVQSVFGQHHKDMQENRIVAVPRGQPAQFRVRFVDAAGRPARSRTLGTKAHASGEIVTDDDGVASITFEPSRSLDRYDLQPLYPGLAVLSYTVVEGGDSGNLIGLPGEPLQGIKEAGAWYYPLGAFLQRAYPLRFADGIRAEGPSIELATDYGLVTLTPSGGDRTAGQVRDREGRVLYEVSMINRQDGPWLDVASLARLMDTLAWGHLTEDGRLLVAAPEIP